jgi:tetratricopeptide (TPR) repeat protein
MPAREAIPVFLEIIRDHPTYGEAMAALAVNYGYLGLFYPNADNIYMPPDAAAALAEPLATKALAIDPLLAEAHAALGFVHSYASRWTDAEAAFRRAIALEPTVTAVYGDFAMSTLLPWGRVADAVRTMQAAMEADPLSLDVRRVLAIVQMSAAEHAQALANLQHIIDIDPQFPFAAQQYTWALLFNNRRDEALERLEAWAVGRIGVRGYIHAIQGRRAEAEAIAAKFAHLPQRQAEIYGLLGDADRALEALGRLAAINPGRAAMYLDAPQIAVLRGDPRSAVFRRKLGFPQ